MRDIHNHKKFFNDLANVLAIPQCKKKVEQMYQDEICQAENRYMAPAYPIVHTIFHL